MAVAFVALAAIGCPKTAPKSSVDAAKAAGPSLEPRADGVYAASVHAADGSDLGWDYLRFFADHKVLSVSSPAPIEKAIVLLAPDSDQAATGTYEIRDGVLHFTMKSKLGAVEYEGVAGKDNLQVHWKSSINSATVDETFAFVPVEGQPSKPAGPPDVSLLPAGSGWFCFHASEPGASRCERTSRQCEWRRKEVSASLKHKPGPCVRHKQAFCHGLVVKDSGEGTVFCYESGEDCDAGLSVVQSANNSGQFTFSACYSE
jgi:hypothetical protein